MPSSLKFYKDKEKALSYRNKQRKRNYSRNKHEVFGGRKFSEFDCSIILNSELLDREIAKTLKRTVQSIQIKRSRLINLRNL